MTTTKNLQQVEIGFHELPSTPTRSKLAIPSSLDSIKFGTYQRMSLEGSNTSSSTTEDFINLPEVQHSLTPTLQNLSSSLALDDNKLEASPSTGSEISNNSNSTDVDTPSTQRSWSSTATTVEQNEKEITPKETILTTHNPCLQCHLIGLRCSFSSKYRRVETEEQRTTCDRCTKNGEEFCIVQVKTEYDGMRGRKNKYEYLARGVEKSISSKKAEKLLGVGREKSRFALPKCDAVVRERFFERWEEMEDGGLEAWVGSKVIHETQKAFWYGRKGLLDWSQVVGMEGSLDGWVADRIGTNT